MAYWSLVILVVSVSFLAYRHPPKSWTALPPWLRSQQHEALPEKARQPTEKDSKSEPSPSQSTNAPSFSVSEHDQDASEEDEGTPKAKATKPSDEVPTISLGAEETLKATHGGLPDTPKPSFPAPNSAQRASAMPPPPKPAASSLMPPPAPKPFGLMPPPSRPNPLPNRAPAGNGSLRIPTTGPLPNRGPPVNSQQRAGSNARGKILLSPGHSPMDWAALSRSKNLAGVPSLQRVTPSMLKQMTGRKGKPAWSSYQGKVYNITPYLPFHPGGEPELMKAAGRDGEKLFMEVHPWVNWEGMMGSSCLVGILVSESESQQSSLDDMD